jgi:hypothetical protein
LFSCVLKNLKTFKRSDSRMTHRCVQSAVCTHCYNYERFTTCRKSLKVQLIFSAFQCLQVYMHIKIIKKLHCLPMYVSCKQGDQTSLWKNRPKGSPVHFLPKFMLKLILGIK